MNKLNNLSVAFGVVGSFLAGLFGGWSTGISVLCIFIVIDFVTGLISASLCKSHKTASGGLSSRVVWQGVAKKLFELILVVVGHQLDLLIGASYVRDAVVIMYIVTEGISILENASLIGLPIPNVIKRVLDVLKEQSDNAPGDETINAGDNNQQ